MLDQVNRELLGGRGSVRTTHVTWGLHMWEAWWGVMLHDSRGTAYLNVQRRRLPLRTQTTESAAAVGSERRLSAAGRGLWPRTEAVDHAAPAKTFAKNHESAPFIRRRKNER